MDNTNTNWPNNPSSAPTNGVTPPSTSAIPDYNSPVPPISQDFTTPPLPSNHPLDPVAPVSPWPAAASPLASPFPIDATNSTWAPPAPIEPAPITSLQPSSPAIGTSPLDNPWGAPIQPPPIDANQNSQPTWTPPTINADFPTNPLPSLGNTPPGNLPVEPGPISDSIPTDLSHLISNNPSTGPSTTGVEGLPPTSAETLVIPPTTTNNPEVPTVSTEDHKGIPKWLIGIGIGLLIMVAGASAYFILGVGQSPKITTSVPAEVTPKQVVKTPPPIATPPPPQTNPVSATGSANFGELQEAPAVSPKQASRAGDLLK